MKNIINSDNWEHLHYQSQAHKAFISFGANPDNIESFLYYTTVVDELDQELYQKEFPELSEACKHLNDRYYGMWKLSEKSPGNGKKDGCSTCVAH